jgi:hypothetical protein
MRSLIFRATALLFIALLSFKSGVAQSFRLGMRAQKDSMIYYVVNETDQVVNAGAIICTWFHNTELMVFWPADIGIGLGTVTQTGTYTGKNVQFNRRTTQRVSFDFDIYPGDSQEFVTVQNYSEQPQEVMCANIRLFYFDTAGRDREADVYPIDQNPCPFKQVYMVGNFSNDGIRFWTVANRLLHYSTTCTTGFDVVVIDRSSLEPVPVPGQTPLCQDGKKWTSWGHPLNEQVYYHFDFIDTTHIPAFVDLVEAINPGDHVFMSHASRNAVNMTDKRVVAALETLGGDPGLLSYIGKKPSENKLIASKVWMAYGNKGSDKGTLEIFADLDVKKEYVLLPDQVYDESKSFAPCFEASLSELEKAQEVLDTNENNLAHISHPPSRIFPNPVNDVLQVFSYFPQEKIALFTSAGQRCEVRVESYSTHLYRIDMNAMGSGVYILKVGEEAHRIIKY